MESSQARILIADDDPALRLILQETLRIAGYEVEIASNGYQLVSMAQNQPPNLLVIDLMMPLMDGFEAIRQLRNDTRTSHLPMIILTARSASSEVVIGFDVGADDYITKPYDTMCYWHVSVATCAGQPSAQYAIHSPACPATSCCRPN